MRTHNSQRLVKECFIGGGYNWKGEQVPAGSEKTDVAQATVVRQYVVIWHLCVCVHMLACVYVCAISLRDCIVGWL